MEINEILDKGYPDRCQLCGFPLEERLRTLDLRVWTRTVRPIDLREDEENELLPSVREEGGVSEKAAREKIENAVRKDNRLLSQELSREELGEIYRHHIVKMMKAINWLTTGQAKKICPVADWSISPLIDFEANLLRIPSKGSQFLRLLALYHDIGKVFHRDRHPALGGHLLEGNKDDESRLIETLEGTEQLLMGVAGLGLGKIDPGARAIDYLVTLNIADMYGTLSEVTPRQLKIVLGDWKYIVNLSSQTVMSQSQLEEKILEHAQLPDNAAERIRRLLVAAMLSKSVKSKYDLSKLEVLADKITVPIIRNALTKRLGPDLRVFCYDFALICKLDYTLRFLETLVSEWISSEQKKQSVELQDINVEGLADIIVEILERLVKNYRDLTRHREGWTRRVGIELMGLSRADEIVQQVIGLLLSDRRIAGVNWIADEATAFYFD